MKASKHQIYLLFIVLLSLSIFSENAYAQRMGHRASRGGGGGGGARMSAGSQRSFSGGGMNTRSVNGGSFKAPNRVQNSSRGNVGDRNMGNLGERNNANLRDRDNANLRDRDNANLRDRDNANLRDRDNRVTNINIDKSRNYSKNFNRNTVARPLPAYRYNRPPYVWGGRRFYSFHPYAYHAFLPYTWGRLWHPWGFFLSRLAVTAVLVAVANENYYYDQGVWYSQYDEGYTAVPAPVDATVNDIPPESETVVVNDSTNYYYGGSYYEKSGTKYKVIPPPVGAVVEHLPEGAEEVKIGDQTYVKLGETYYQPIEGNKYEVVQVEKDTQ